MNALNIQISGYLQLCKTREFKFQSDVCVKPVYFSPSDIFPSDTPPSLSSLSRYSSLTKAKEIQDMADVSYFGDTGARWSALQLWQAMKMIVAAPGGTVPYWTLRDTVFGGNDDVILSLIKSKLTVFVKLVHLSLYALHSIAFNTLHTTHR